MMLACICLNVTVRAATNDFQKVTPEFLGLSEEEKNDKFFKQDVQIVRNMVSVLEVHQFLIKKRNVGAWIISQCINCDCHTHAAHRQKGVVIVYSKLLDSKAIESVKSSDIFSTIYNIVVNPNDIGVDINPNEMGIDQKRSDTNRYFTPRDVDYSLGIIKEIMTKFIRKESVNTEQNIKKFTDEQYEMLTYWKDRASREHRSLVRVICYALEHEPGSLLPPSSSTFTTSSSSSRPFRQTDTKSSSFTTSTLSTSISTSFYPPSSDKKEESSSATDIDDLVFQMDNVDVDPDLDLDPEESDKEDVEEGISIPRSSKSRSSIAKSLPMDIPTFMSKPRHTEESDDGSPIGENVDIAASIKALARSVHGEPVFGDLPRPRFSTKM